MGLTRLFRRGPLAFVFAFAAIIYWALTFVIDGLLDEAYSWRGRMVFALLLAVTLTTATGIQRRTATGQEAILVDEALRRGEFPEGSEPSRMVVLLRRREISELIRRPIAILAMVGFSLLMARSAGSPWRWALVAFFLALGIEQAVNGWREVRRVRWLEQRLGVRSASDPIES